MKKRTLKINKTYLKLILICTTLLITFNIQGVFASELNTVQDVNNSEKIIVPYLELGEKYSQTFILSDGEVGTLSVTKTAELESGSENLSIPYGWSEWHTQNNISNGSYEINVVTPGVSAGFTIDVYNNNITNAYNPWHYIIITNATGTLQRDSSKQYSYYMNFNMSIPWVGGPSWTGGVRATIEGNNLVTYWN